jgi:hypothetical protein
MKKALVALFIVVLMVSFTRAADVIAPKTAKGNRALLFSFNGLGGILLSGLSTVFGSTDETEELVGTKGHPNLNSTILYSPGVGGLYYFRNYTALRFGVGFGNIKSNADKDGDVSESNSMMAVSAGLQHHLANVTAVSIYTGGELYYGSLSSTAKNTKAKTENTTSYSGIGIAGLVGAQFYPWKNVSFDFEYKLGYASFSATGETKAGSESDNWEGGSTTVMGISNWGVSLVFHF